MDHLEKLADDSNRVEAVLSKLFTVEQAARAMGVGRSQGYKLANAYESSGGEDGLPVIRIGKALRVPEWALIELMRTGRVVNLRQRKANIRIAPVTE